MSVNTLLDFIGTHESRGDYNIVWGGIRAKDRPPRPLVTMTVGEVLNWQDGIDARYMSEAAGKYQIMEDTLRELVAQGHASKHDKFDKGTQDKLAIALLKRRGLDSYLSGKIDAGKFANFVAREWASMPVVSGPKAGRSYYDGDGLNSTKVSVASFMRAIKAVKNDPQIIPPKYDAQAISPWTAFWNALFGGWKK